MITAQWIEAFEPLAAIDGAARHVLARAASVMTLPAGTVAFSPGQPCDTYVLVIAGSIRVHMVSETGREIVLYRVETGQTCILTTACLLSEMSYSAEAIAETEVQVALLPRPAFRELMARSAVFRDFVFQAFGDRLAGLLLLVEEVAFRRIDLRLARLLLERREVTGSVPLAHQDIAVELGTVREVVSRQLKEFERRGWVALHRGRIDICAPLKLKELAAGPS